MLIPEGVSIKASRERGKIDEPGHAWFEVIINLGMKPAQISSPKFSKSSFCSGVAFRKESWRKFAIKK